MPNPPNLNTINLKNMAAAQYIKSYKGEFLVDSLPFGLQEFIRLKKIEMLIETRYPEKNTDALYSVASKICQLIETKKDFEEYKLIFFSLLKYGADPLSNSYDNKFVIFELIKEDETLAKEFTQAVINKYPYSYQTQENRQIMNDLLCHTAKSCNIESMKALFSIGVEPIRDNFRSVLRDMTDQQRKHTQDPTKIKKFQEILELAMEYLEAWRIIKGEKKISDNVFDPLNIIYAIENLKQSTGINYDKKNYLSLIVYAASMYDTKLIEYLLSDEEIKNHLSQKDATYALHQVISKIAANNEKYDNYNNILDSLITLNVDLSASLNFIETTKGSEKLIKKLIDAGAKFSNNCSLLIEAAREGSQELVEYFIQQGANVNALDKYGDNALHKVIQGMNNYKSDTQTFEKYKAILKILLEKKINQQVINHSGEKPIDYATDSELLKILAELGMTVDKENDQLLVQAANNHVIQTNDDSSRELFDYISNLKGPLNFNQEKSKIESLIFIKGADLNFIDSKTGMSALHAILERLQVLDYYGSSEYSKVVNLLLEHGADPNLEITEGKYAGFKALNLAQNKDLIIKLSDVGAELNPNKNCFGLFFAALNKDVKRVELLLSKDAKADSTNSGGYTAIDTIIDSICNDPEYKESLQILNLLLNKQSPLPIDKDLIKDYQNQDNYQNVKQNGYSIYENEDGYFIKQAQETSELKGCTLMEIDS